jgi:hypothetical protein
VIDLGNLRDIDRLYGAIDGSREAMRPFRDVRIEMLNQFVGSWYNTEGAKNGVIVNLLNLTAETYTIGLVASNPRVRVTTPFRQFWPFAYRWQQSLDNFIKEVHFSETLQDIVLDAMFSMGIAKVFQGPWRSVQLEGDVWADPGRPYLGRISPDDFGLDMGVKDVRRCRFMWDEYRVSWKTVKTHPDYDKSVVAQLSPDSKWARSDETANDISTGSLVDDDEYEPMIDLMDVWLPELEKVAVFSRHVQTKPLKVLDAGPEGGPYRILSFLNVPDNVIPLAPLQNLMTLHLLYNRLLHKGKSQALSQKTNPTYRPSASEDAKRIDDAPDRKWVKVNDPASVGMVSLPGVDQPTVAFSMAVSDLFSRQAGNLDAMAGLGPQAQTYGQEKIIASAVSRKEARMQNRVHAFTAALMGDVGQLMWHDGFLQVPANFEVAPGSGIFADASWTPEQREGDFWQYNFDIIPGSMNYEPAEVKIAKIERAMGQVGQLLPVLQALGGDPQEFIKQYAELLQVPELERMFNFNAAPGGDRPGPQGSPGEGMRMPSQTTRNYVRRNVPTGGTPQSRSMVMQQAFLGGGQVTPQQGASMMRPAV